MARADISRLVRLFQPDRCQGVPVVRFQPRSVSRMDVHQISSTVVSQHLGNTLPGNKRKTKGVECRTECAVCLWRWLEKKKSFFRVMV